MGFPMDFGFFECPGKKHMTVAWQLKKSQDFHQNYLCDFYLVKLKS